jgi:tetratricopeptide (TPR) repeat protein
MVRITEHDPEPASASPRDAEAHKLEGNRAFGEGRFEDAERHYTAALEASASTSDEGASDEPDETGDASARREEAREDDRATGAGTTDGATDGASSVVRSNEDGKTTTSKDVVVVDRARATYFANRAACRLKLARPNEAAEDCTRALRCDESFVKARLRRAEARETADPKDLEGALADCEAAAADVDADAGLRLHAETAAARLRPLVEARREALKEEMLGTLRGLGDALLGNFGLSTKNFEAEKDATGAYSVRFVRNPS